MDKLTQRDRILALLRGAGGDWVPLPAILDLRVSQYGARLLELRRAGHNIEMRLANYGRVRHTWYRIVERT